MILFALLAGVVLALGVVAGARRTGRTRARRIYAVGLMVAALIYVAFAVVEGRTDRWLALEVVGLLGFGAAAVVGFRFWPIALALGWAAHVGWDMLHLRGVGAQYTPDWYPWLCVGFDLVIAGAVLMHGRQHDASTSLSAG
jgi:hypothetical protein